MKEIKINLGNGNTNFNGGNNMNQNNNFSNNNNNYYGGNPEFNQGFNNQQQAQMMPVNNNNGYNVYLNKSMPDAEDSYYTNEILKYIFGDKNDKNNMLNDNYSETFNEIIYALLFDGLAKMKETDFAKAKNELSANKSASNFDILNAKGLSKSIDGTRSGYSVTMENDEYSITFYVGISKTFHGLMPALDNFVYSTMQSNNAFYNKGIVMDDEFISGFAPFIYPVLERHGIPRTELKKMMRTYPSLLLHITDRIVDFVNEFGNNIYLMNLAKSGIISFGGITIYPDIDNEGVMCRMELDNQIRYRLKTDINFSEADDRQTRMNYGK